jgi:mono/diheme cytochrome c family protein
MTIRTVLLAAAFGAAVVGVANAQSTQSELVKRGDYLVNGVLTCGNCHSPKGPPEAISGKDFSGGLSWDEPPFKVTAPNITPDKETGIGAWTDAEIRTVMRTGIRPNGVHVAMIMPTGFYHIMTERDLNAVVAYLRTLKPVSNKVEDPIYKVPQVEIVIPGGERAFTEDLMTDKVKKGFYLVTIAHCMECHTPMEKGARQWDRLGAGGFEFRGPWASPLRATSHRARPRGSGAGATKRSSAPSPWVPARTAASSSRRWAINTTRR